jgi:hypothetical protein
VEKRVEKRVWRRVWRRMEQKRRGEWWSDWKGVVWWCRVEESLEKRRVKS